MRKSSKEYAVLDSDIDVVQGDDSQCWLKEYFKLLVKRNIVDQAVLDVLEAAPEF